jgi:hypothetical protein
MVKLKKIILLITSRGSIAGGLWSLKISSK